MENRLIWAFDPGGTWGAVALWMYKFGAPARVLCSWEVPVNGPTDVLCMLDRMVLACSCDEFPTGIPDVVVYEGFRLRPQKPGVWGTDVGLSPVKGIGMLQMALVGVYGFEGQWREQMPHQKDVVTNDYLRIYGYWHKGGKGHANDAMRHFIVWARKQRSWVEL